MEDTEVQAALVIDIPSELSAEEATLLLNEQYERGYYIHRALERHDGARVFMVAKAKSVAGTGPPQTTEAKAMQFLRDNREMPLTQLCAGLKALKHPRSSQWVREKLSQIVIAERRLTL